MKISRRSDIKSKLSKSSNIAKGTNIHIIDGFDEEGGKNRNSFVKFITATDFAIEKEKINKLESEVSLLLKKIGK